MTGGNYFFFSIIEFMMQILISEGRRNLKSKARVKLSTNANVSVSFFRLH